MGSENKLLVYASLKLSKTHKQWIQDLRRSHDEAGFNFIEPHITLLSYDSQKDELNQLQRVIEDIALKLPHSAVIRSALWMPPLFNHSSWYLFLIPEEGYSELVKFQQNLASAVEHQQSFPFIPHLCIGKFQQSEACKALAKEINDGTLNIPIVMDKLKLATVSNHQLNVIEEFVVETL